MKCCLGYSSEGIDILAYRILAAELAPHLRGEDGVAVGAAPLDRGLGDGLAVHLGRPEVSIDFC